MRLVRGTQAGTDELGWDPDKGAIDADGLEGIGAVVHLAGAGIGDKRWTPARKRLILESRTKGTASASRGSARRELRRTRRRPLDVSVRRSGTTATAR